MDVGNDTDTVPITIYLDDANDSPRFAYTTYNATVAENKPAGTFVKTVQATDTDQQPGNREFIYEMDDSGMPFTIDAQSGRISTKRE